MFEIKRRKKGEFREGKIITKNGVIFTPFFMPDATRGFVKFLTNEDLKIAGVETLVVNTYHLYLDPGIELIKKAGGLRKFINWNGLLLSDSGGYQVFSLIHKNSQGGKITDEGVIFKSPLDGSIHKLTPEKSIQIQFDLGVDMMVCFDDPPPVSFSWEKTRQAVERTLLWAKRCLMEYQRQLKKRKITKENRPLIFSVIQGGKYLDLREYCARELTKIGLSLKNEWFFGWDGYGFGARHLDEQGNFMAEVLEKTASFIPENALRFALGVGTPEDIIKCFSYGWDMFDCVIPTREGRHGRLFIWKDKPENFSVSDLLVGKKFYFTININNEKYKNDFNVVDENCDCQLCSKYSRSYLRHLFKSNDPLGPRLASLHNLHFYQRFMRILRQK